ncbi:hypothetical protein ACFVZ3_01665 [Kitasatospora purpeofusca]|uniref:hypothetical protein n=1 Tax=Kitasatospora purpeofusca TaxID=67352 RepID=UPI0036535DD1
MLHPGDPRGGLTGGRGIPWWHGLDIRIDALVNARLNTLVNALINALINDGDRRTVLVRRSAVERPLPC